MKPSTYWAVDSYGSRLYRTRTVASMKRWLIKHKPGVSWNQVEHFCAAVKAARKFNDLDSIGANWGEFCVSQLIAKEK